MDGLLRQGNCIRLSLRCARIALCYNPPGLLSPPAYPCTLLFHYQRTPSLGRSRSIPCRSLLRSLLHPTLSSPHLLCLIADSDRFLHWSVPLLLSFCACYRPPFARCNIRGSPVLSSSTSHRGRSRIAAFLRSYPAFAQSLCIPLEFPLVSLSSCSEPRQFPAWPHLRCLHDQVA